MVKFESECVPEFGLGESSTWVTLFLGEHKCGNLALQVVESQIWDGKIRWWVLWDWNPRKTALARTGRSCKLQTHPLVRRMVHVNKPSAVWQCPTPRQTLRPTVAHNMTLTMNRLYEMVFRRQLVESRVSGRWPSACEDLSPGTDKRQQFS
jgi:hypothetical protein